MITNEELARPPVFIGHGAGAVNGCGTQIPEIAPERMTSLSPQGLHRETGGVRSLNCGCELALSPLARKGRMAHCMDKRNCRVLVIDDNPSIHEDFAKILLSTSTPESPLPAANLALFGEATQADVRPTFEVEFALQGRTGLDRLEQASREGCPYAMAFVDMRMPPGWDGLETIEHLWAADSELQVVICSAHSDYDWMDVFSRLGHADKLLIVKKPFETIEILQCASALTRKWQMARELRQHVATLEKLVTARTQGLETANKQLRHLATHDPLTGLPNRVLLEDRLSHAIAVGERSNGTFGLIVLDLDRFKVINDSLGHKAGDDLLKEVAHRLNSGVRQVDTVARLGGDEFVLIVSPIAGQDDINRVAVRILEDFQRPVSIAGVDVRVTPSVGIAFNILATVPPRRLCSRERMRRCTSPNSAVVTTSSVMRRE